MTEPVPVRVGNCKGFLETDSWAAFPEIAAGVGVGGGLVGHSFTGNVIRHETFLPHTGNSGTLVHVFSALFLPPSSYFTFHMDNITNTLESPEHYLQEQLHSLPSTTHSLNFIITWSSSCLLKCNCLTTYTPSLISSFNVTLKHLAAYLSHDS